MKSNEQPVDKTQITKDAILYFKKKHKEELKRYTLKEQLNKCKNYDQLIATITDIALRGDHPVASRVFASICFADKTAEEAGIADFFRQQMSSLGYLNEEQIKKAHAFIQFFVAYSNALDKEKQYSYRDLNKDSIFFFNIENLIEVVLLNQHEVNDPLFTTFKEYFVDNESIDQEAKNTFLKMYQKKKAIADKAQQTVATFFNVYDTCLNGQHRVDNLQNSDDATLEKVIDAVLQQGPEDHPLRKAFNQFFTSIQDPEILHFISMLYLDRLDKKNHALVLGEEKQADLPNPDIKSFETKEVAHFLEFYDAALKQKGYQFRVKALGNDPNKITPKNIVDAVIEEQGEVLCQVFQNYLSEEHPADSEARDFFRRLYHQRSVLKQAVNNHGEEKQDDKEKEKKLIHGIILSSGLNMAEKEELRGISLEQFVDTVVSNPATLLDKAFNDMFLRRDKPNTDEVKRLENLYGEKKKEETDAINYFLQKYDDAYGLVNRPLYLLKDLSIKKINNLLIMQKDIAHIFMNICFADETAKANGMADFFLQKWLQATKKELKHGELSKIQALPQFFVAYDNALKKAGNEEPHKDLDVRKKNILQITPEELIEAVLLENNKDTVLRRTFEDFISESSQADQGVKTFLTYKYQTRKKIKAIEERTIAGFFEIYDALLSRIDPPGKRIPLLQEGDDGISFIKLINCIIREEGSEDSLVRKAFSSFIKSIQNDSEVLSHICQLYSNKLNQMKSPLLKEKKENMPTKDDVDSYLLNFNSGKKDLSEFNVYEIIDNLVIGRLNKLIFGPVFEKVCFRFEYSNDPQEQDVSSFVQYKLAEKVSSLDWLRIKSVAEFLRLYDEELSLENPNEASPKENSDQFRIEAWKGGSFFNISPEQIVDAVIQEGGKIAKEVFEREFLTDRGNAPCEVRDFFQRLYYQKRLQAQVVEVKEEDNSINARKEQQLIIEILKDYDIQNIPSKYDLVCMSLEQFADAVFDNPGTKLENACNTFFSQDQPNTPQIKKFLELYADKKEKHKKAIDYFYDGLFAVQWPQQVDDADKKKTIKDIIAGLKEKPAEAYAFMKIGFADGIAMKMRFDKDNLDESTNEMATLLLDEWIESEKESLKKAKLLRIRAVTQFFEIYRDELRNARKRPYENLDVMKRNVLTITPEEIIETVLFKQNDRNVLFRTFERFISDDSPVDSDVKQFFKERYEHKKAIADRAQEEVTTRFLQIYNDTYPDDKNELEFNADNINLEELIDSVISEQNPDELGWSPRCKLGKAFNVFIKTFSEEDPAIVCFICDLYSDRLRSIKNEAQEHQAGGEEYKDELEKLRTKAVEQFLKAYDLKLKENNQLRIEGWDKDQDITPEKIVDAFIEEQGSILGKVFKEKFLNPESTTGSLQVRAFFQRLYYQRISQKKLELQSAAAEEVKQEDILKKQPTLMYQFLERYYDFLKANKNYTRVNGFPGSASQANGMSIEKIALIIANHPRNLVSTMFNEFFRRDRSPSPSQKIEVAELKRTYEEAKRKTEKTAVDSFLDAYHASRRQQRLVSISPTWPESKNENDMMIEEIILYAMANPKTRTATILKEKFSLDVKKPPQGQTASVDKNNESWRIFQGYYHEVYQKEAKQVNKFLSESKKRVKNGFFGGLFNFSEWSNADPKKVRLTDIIDHSRKSMFTRGLSFIPGIRSGNRSYEILFDREKFNLNTRNDLSKGKRSERIAAEFLRQRK